MRPQPPARATVRTLAAAGLLVLAGALAGAWLLRPSPDRSAPFADAPEAGWPDAGMAAHMGAGPAFADAVQAATHRRRVAGTAHSAPQTSDAANGTSAGLLLPLLLASLGRDDLAPTRPGAEPPVDGPSYWRDAYPVLARRCTGCHLPGGIAPMPLDSYAAAKENAALIRWAMEDRFMPPLPADPATSWPLDDPRIMSEAERATLVTWVAAGAPEGDPETAPEIAPPENPLGPPSHRFDIGVDYEPRGDRTDDYRCFVIDPGLSQDAEVRMFDIQPGDAKIYHHGILHLITPDQLEDIRRLDAADPGPGYSCFGGPGLARSPWIATKTPGQAPMASPAGTAIRLPAGSVMVLQNHYNILNGSGKDRTRVDLWVSQAPVGREPRLPKLANLSFRIPAGSPAYTATASARVGLIGEARPGLVWQAWPHMHLLGSRFSFDVKRRDGTTVRLLDIPAWDFNWQGGYSFATPFELKTGDEIIMTCVWDNSPANQAFVDGRQQPPREVRWGEGSLDEMCLGGLTIVDP